MLYVMCCRTGIDLINQSINHYSFNEQSASPQTYEVQWSECSITIKVAKYLGLIGVFIQHVCNKISPTKVLSVHSELE